MIRESTYQGKPRETKYTISHVMGANLFKNCYVDDVMLKPSIRSFTKSVKRRIRYSNMNKKTHHNFQSAAVLLIIVGRSKETIVECQYESVCS